MSERPLASAKFFLDRRGPFTPDFVHVDVQSPLFTTRFSSSYMAAPVAGPSSIPSNGDKNAPRPKRKHVPEPKVSSDRVASEDNRAKRTRLDATADNGPTKTRQAGPSKASGSTQNKAVSAAGAGRVAEDKRKGAEDESKDGKSSNVANAPKPKRKRSPEVGAAEDVSENAEQRVKRLRVDAPAPARQKAATAGSSTRAPAPDAETSVDVAHNKGKSKEGVPPSGGKGKGRATEPSVDMEDESADDDEEIDEGEASDNKASSSKPKRSVRRLDPPRPWPTVAPSVSATGPRSAHHEGKNYICITRKTKLGAYLRRCKELVIKDGCVMSFSPCFVYTRIYSGFAAFSYKTLHLSAMGAAIPQLATLSVSLPAILPHAADEIKTEVLTGTVEVQDELIPADDNLDEDVELRTRCKSVLKITITIGDGEREVAAGSHNKVRSERPRGARRIRGRRGKGGGKGKQAEAEDRMDDDAGERSAPEPGEIVMQEPEQELEQEHLKTL